MKKIFYGIGFLVLSILMSTPTFAKNLDTGICADEFSIPKSCWKSDGTPVQQKSGDTWCNPSTGNLSDSEIDEFLTDVKGFKEFIEKRETTDPTLIKLKDWSIPEGDATNKMKEIQKLVEKYYAGHKIGDKIVCTFEKHGTDQKYGLCTKHAMEQFTNDIKDDCIEPSLIVIPSTRCRIEINFKNALFPNIKLRKQEEAKNAKSETPSRIISEATELEKEIGARLGKTINFVSLGGKKFYFDVGNGNATSFKEKTEAVLRDEDFGEKTEKTKNEFDGTLEDKKYSLILLGASVKKEHCVFDVLENVDIGGLRPRYLVGASDGTRKLSGSVHDITYWFQRFGRKIVGFIAAIAVFFIVWNAFGMVMSMGDADKISSSKKAIQWILIGLALAIFAYVIIKTIISLTYLTTVDYVEPTSIGTEK